MVCTGSRLARFGAVARCADRRNEHVVDGDATSSDLGLSLEVSNWLRRLPTVPALQVLLGVP